ncbi:hypothetical protein SBRY_30321 [Actinacidiphila bryophytorum]|uniref:Uncharacterized protein n=1 Tax=Actinacidiphila bryophytorum TaxID=1436133 RepID=A0A9W4MGJ2_9ACTN|nr:hypothetical protein SBRY_30321 [Actinacidiphila bryophytorum]
MPSPPEAPEPAPGGNRSADLGRCARVPQWPLDSSALQGIGLRPWSTHSSDARVSRSAVWCSAP